jgi:membrane protein implicated in regulation of membrane protease activity
MHIVVIAWLYVILMMALTSASLPGGVALFAGAGLAPVLLLAWLLRRRSRRASVLEQQVHERDAPDAEADQ